MLSCITSFFAADWTLVGYELLKPEDIDNTPEQTCQQKIVIPMTRIINQYKDVL